MNQTQASRLLTLAHFLKTQVNEDEFDMYSWGAKKFVCEEDGEAEVVPEVFGGALGEVKKEYQLASKKITCGTSACALGWATAVFPETFRLAFSDPCIQDAIDRALEYPGDEEQVHADVEMKVGGEWDGWNSEFVGKFFGLSGDSNWDAEECHPSEINLLFGGDDMTAKEKAKQIEQLVSSKGWIYAK